MTIAEAHPNIALVKYWGKQDKPGNIPATPNLSITLSELTTRTQIEDYDVDELWLNDKLVDDNKVKRFLGALRNRHDIPPIKISTTNNFPTGAGLASSASGFAALIVAVNTHFDLHMDAEMMSDWARQGSASAARSIFAGFVALVPPQWSAHQLAPPSWWKLNVVVGVTDLNEKAVSSTKGMELSKKTSPYYKTWQRTSADDFAVASDAVNRRDFGALADIAELSCLKMHSVMLTTQPTLAYWNAATISCMEEIRQLRASGINVFFTIDAGPQIKAVCLPEDTNKVEIALAKLPGVIKTYRCGLGEGARIISPSTVA